MGRHAPFHWPTPRAHSSFACTAPIGSNVRIVPPDNAWRSNACRSIAIAPHAIARKAIEFARSRDRANGRCNNASFDCLSSFSRSSSSFACAHAARLEEFDERKRRTKIDGRYRSEKDVHSFAGKSGFCSSVFSAFRSRLCCTRV